MQTNEKHKQEKVEALLLFLQKVAAKQFTQ